MENNLLASKQASNYNAIDLFKFIFAFAVVSIHTNPLETCKIQWILRLNETINNLAVPFYFISLGFFLGLKYNKNSNDNIVIKKIYQLLKMYLTWMLIYTPIAIAYYIRTNTSFLNACIRYIIGLIFVGEQYNSWILWYLLSAIYTLVAIYFLSKKGISNKCLIVISIVAFIIVIILSYIGNYNGNSKGLFNIIQKVTITILSSGRIFKGLIFIPLGILFSNMHNNIDLRLCFISLIIGIVGCMLLDTGASRLSFNVISSIALFGILRRVHFSNNVLYTNLRKMSTSIYLIHLYVWTVYYTIVYGTKTYGLDCFIVTSIVSTIIAWLYCNYKSGLLLGQRY